MPPENVNPVAEKKLLNVFSRQVRRRGSLGFLKNTLHPTGIMGKDGVMRFSARGRCIFNFSGLNLLTKVVAVASAELGKANQIRASVLLIFCGIQNEM